MVNIINAGGWYVGNTAILDWLDGFEEVAYIKGDLNICRQENGLLDILAESRVEAKLVLLNKIKKDSLFCAKNLTRAFIGRYTKHLFKRVKPIPYSSSFSYYKSLYNFCNGYINGIMRHSDFDEIEYTRNWLHNLALISVESKAKVNNIVYQNPFFYSETFAGHDGVWEKLFNPYKLIFVHRDPVDQFCDIVRSGDHKLASWARFHGDTSSLHPVERFLVISKKIYTARIRIAKESTKNNLLIFSFEDFILDHETIACDLKNYLGINSERDHNNKRFLLSESKKNINKGQFDNKTIQLLSGRESAISEIRSMREELIQIYNGMI